VIQGAVFVEARDNFSFDALFIRVEGISIMIQVMNFASGLREAPKTEGSSQETKYSIHKNICFVSTPTDSSKVNICTLFLCKYLKTFLVHTNLKPLTPGSVIK
jgi:hypothetical protein